MLILHEDSVISLECFFPLSKKKKIKMRKITLMIKGCIAAKHRYVRLKEKKRMKGTLLLVQ